MKTRVIQDDPDDENRPAGADDASGRGELDPPAPGGAEPTVPPDQAHGPHQTGTTVHTC